jgi:MFS family permease
MSAELAVHSGTGHWRRRQLAHYPTAGRRYGYVGLVVVVTVVLYYQQYVGGAVGPSVLAHFQMSFRYYLSVVVVSNAAGALASLVAGLGDRVGRANMAVGGLLVAGMITAFGIPAAPTALDYAVAVSAVGFVEGLVLVSTPALVRDFSAQSGRGRAMGFWTMGPVVGSLVVSEVASHTLDHLHAWQDQFHIAGATALVVGAVSFVLLRELAPQLRDQLMVSVRERALVEARARGVDVAAAVRRPWRQMVGVDTVVPALGVSLFLLIYYAAVAFFVIYFTTVFGFSQARANSLGNWFWAADAVTVVVVGALSDRIGVRKPIVVVGGVAGIAMTIVFATRATDPSTSYGTFVVIISLLSVSRATAYAPWMAAFTETVERRNPALVATGLAVWGWVLRVVVLVSFLVLPAVVSSVTPVADYAPRLQMIESRYGPQVATLQAIDPATRAALRAGTSPAAVSRATQEIAGHFHIPASEALGRLLAVRGVPVADRDYLAAHGAEVLAARRAAPGQWQRWWWVCVGGEIVFLPTVLLLGGRWLPATARRDAEEHRRRVERALAELATVPVAAE